jgi:hypothetical protein
MSTAVAVAILASLAFSTAVQVPSGTDLKTMLMLVGPMVLPRITLAIFVELFAFFFLRLYRTVLADIKFYQNELTNVEGWFSALQVAAATRDTEVLKAAVTALLETERNFILKAGESTPEIEKLKAEQITTKELLAALTEVAKAKREK